MITDEMAKVGACAICARLGEAWDDADEDTRYRWKSMARAAIEASAPAIKAAALEEAAKVADDECITADNDVEEAMASVAIKIAEAIRELKDTP
jgi:hypothetical protein